MFVVRLPANETEGLWLVYSVLFIIEVLCITTVFGYHFLLKHRNHSVRSHGEPVQSPPESEATISNAPSSIDLKTEDNNDGG